MQPLDQCPPAQLAAVRGVLTDIDDTLTEAGAIAPEALTALQRLAAAGIPVIAITGRPAGWSEPFALAWPVHGIVAENGAVLLRRDGERLSVEFSQDEATRRDNFARLQRCAAAVLAEVPGSSLARDSSGRLTDIAIDHSEFAHLDAMQIEAVCAVMRTHGLQATVSSIHINGWIGAHSKWTAAQWAVPRLLGLDFDPADWLFVGDSSNDQLMFEHLPLSVGVANIARFLPQLQHRPRYLTRGERGSGFAELAQRLLAARTVG
ncbi:HAD-IIB family hydrolase [Paucibacter sp. APW11]|uniref:HAD-IIB family hydrolase n=1 Tax=Roseateles aquae TaxID=3077235 RepID=A0ABU3PAR5_9BURK|nr:HAD-IIB family hydrolase [Paucibacter sp. APW11]MDT8999669.1 HAD-IIB family hydrolase [Paucibacter sp. APW11]